MYRQQSEPRMGDQGTHLIHFTLSNFIPFLTLMSPLNHRLALHESNLNRVRIRNRFMIKITYLKILALSSTYFFPTCFYLVQIR